MPLIETEPKGRWSHVRFQIDTETKQDLLLYCKFTTNTPDWVIRGALKVLFRSDPEFGPWRDQQKLATVEIIKAEAAKLGQSAPNSSPAGTSQNPKTVETQKR